MAKRLALWFLLLFKCAWAVPIARDPPSLRGSGEAEEPKGSHHVPRFRVHLAEKYKQDFTGRIRLYIDRKNANDPQELVFGKNVFNFGPGSFVDFTEDDDEVFGFPAKSMGELRRLSVDKRIFVKAELVVYKLYNRTGISPTWLPTSCVSKMGENSVYNRPDGTILSIVESFFLKNVSIDVMLDQQVPDSTPKSPGCARLGDGVDSQWIKTVRLNSSLLSGFWNMPVQLEACVLLPWGFHDHPDVRYPLVLAHGHYNSVFLPGGGFREEEPDCDMKQNYSCYEQHAAHQLYADWTSQEGPFKGARALVATLNHPIPFFDDSYAVNSENAGPYGDAIVKELLPEIERRFRGIGDGWARALLGGSTGGWISLAQQIFYPGDFNGILSACPDPVAFTSYVSTNIYDSENYYFYSDDWLKRPRPGERDHYSGLEFVDGKGPTFVDSYGQITMTLEEANHQELALGSNGRSCGQFDAWEAVFSPVCSDGFPCRLFDKASGEINTSVAQYWREHYDLSHILRRDWAKLGPKLRNKIRIVVGASDTFYLNNAVMDLRHVFEELESDANVTFGTHDGIGYQHCFNGYMKDADGKVLPNSFTRNYYLQMNLPIFAEQWARSAPTRADETAWRY